jgi:uncharacterized membrane protein YeaQ/YmgE (transglycosylase-associated protein family)
MQTTDPSVNFLLVLVIGVITSALIGVAGAFVGYHVAILLALGGGIVTSVIAAVVGAAVVLLGWRMAK